MVSAYSREVITVPKLSFEVAPRYKIIAELINARIRKGLTQEELAKIIGTKQSTIARIESGNANPSLKSMEKFAEGVGARLCIKVN